MNASMSLQDSGLADSRLLSRLVQAGTLVLDEQDALRFASRGACELFGVDGEATLRRHWRDVGDQLRLAYWPRGVVDGHAHFGKADVTTPAGVRPIRYEMHAIADGPDVHRAVLVRDRASLLPTDRALLLASEAQANRHVLTGLVHAAKGPLNNFNLTLALLSAAISRAEGAGSELVARRERYLEVLRNEAVRLAACIDEIDALTLRHQPTNETFDVAALSADCVRVLRHGATMREIVLDLDVPGSPVMAFGDPHLVRLALLSFAISVLDLTSSGGRVGWRITQVDRARLVTMTTTEPALPRSLAASLFRLSCTAESQYSAAITGRLIIEAQGGEVTIRDGAHGQPGLSLSIPAARPARS
ncbi:MAG TPA: hypothetical protein VJ891_02830 [Casimicrobiaceae bacterium]|nr:hypothetical protein [Casimicrobiaceae bacterium]